jgi:hypothetical protein
MWAFPIGNSAKSEMRTVYKDWDRYRGQAKRLAVHIEKEFEPTKIYEKFINILGISKDTIEDEYLSLVLHDSDTVEY